MKSGWIQPTPTVMIDTSQFNVDSTAVDTAAATMEPQPASAFDLLDEAVPAGGAESTLGAFARKAKDEIEADRERVFKLFPRLLEREKQKAGTLSGGEQQMLAVGRAMMLRPRLMLLDEPSFGLAPLVVRDLIKILGKINREDKVTILVVEQNAQLALELADQAYVIETGRIVMSGNAKDIANNEDVRKSYLGY